MYAFAIEIAFDMFDASNLRFTFFRGKEIKSSYSSGHLHKQIFQGTRSSHQIENSHLSLRIVHLRGKVIKTMI